MKESDAIRKWISEHEKENQHAFIYKIPDTPKGADGRPVGATKKPFDLIAFFPKHGVIDKYNLIAEFKIATSTNPAAALSKLATHQIDALVRLGKIFDSTPDQAACIVYLPQELRGGRNAFWYYYAGGDCRDCCFKAAPHLSVCKRCPYSKDGGPNI